MKNFNKAGLLVAILLLFALVGTSCNQSPIYSKTYEPTKTTKIEDWFDPKYEELNKENDWIGPVEIPLSELHPGQTIEQPELPPIKFHNGKLDDVNKKWLVTTGDNDNQMNVTLPLPVYKIDQLKINSTLDKDKLFVVSYKNNKDLVIGGLADNSERYVDVQYTPALYLITKLVDPDKEFIDKGYQPLPVAWYDWFKFDESTLASSFETGQKNFKITIPFQVQTPTGIKDLKIEHGTKYAVFIECRPVQMVMVQKAVNVIVEMEFK